MEVSLKELDNLCNDAAILREEIDAIENMAKEKRDELNILNTKILTLLEAHDKKSWKTNLADIEVRERLSVPTLKTDEQKQKLFPWLQQRGIFWQLVNINSQTLNAFYKEEMSACARTGEEFNIPGLEEPVLSKQIIIRKKR